MKGVKQLIREAEELLGKQSEEQKQNILRQLRGTDVVLGPALDGDSISIWQYDDHDWDHYNDEGSVDARETEVIENNHLFLEGILDLLTPPVETVRGSLTYGSLLQHRGVYEFKIIPKGVVVPGPGGQPQVIPLSDITLNPTPNGIRWAPNMPDAGLDALRVWLLNPDGVITSSEVYSDIRFRAAVPTLGPSFKVEMSEPSRNATQTVRSRALRGTGVADRRDRPRGDQTFYAAFTQVAVSRLRNLILKDVHGYPPWT